MKSPGTHCAGIVASIMLALTSTAAPSDLPLASTADLYVSNYRADVVAVYAPSGTYLRSFGAPGLNGPRGILFISGGALPGGALYVSSQISNEVFVFDYQEQFLFKFGHADFSGPTGMAVSPDGLLYVSSFGNDRVLVFDQAGNYQRQFTGGGLNGPNCVAFDSVGMVYVASALTSRVLKFDDSDNFLFSFTGAGLSSPMGIARDDNDVLYVAGGSSHNIVKFSTSGALLGTITHADLTGPQGVAFDERGHLFSSSFYQDKLVEFDDSGNYVQTIDAGGLDIPRSIAFMPGPEEPGVSVCFGDGTGAPCPCGNDSPVLGAGCRHSGGVGMSLTASGSTSLAADDLFLTAHDCPMGNTGIFYVGKTSLAPGNVLFDGLQCAGGSAMRFTGQLPVGGTATDTGFVAQDSFGLYWTAGTTYVFQYFTRDNQAGPSPCGGFANLSSAYAVTMTP